MAKLNQKGRSMYETPQITPDQLSTEQFGGMAPTKEDVIKSANARAQKRHEMKNASVADVEVLPESTELLGNEMVGIQDSGYLTKKGLEFGVNAFYNSLPPGMDIEDQEVTDIRREELNCYEGGLGYPGDGWVRRPRGAQMPKTKDYGRNAKTNYVGGNGQRATRVSGGGN